MRVEVFGQGARERSGSLGVVLSRVWEDPEAAEADTLQQLLAPGTVRSAGRLRARALPFAIS